MNTQGTFITFEGPEGSGKSTHVRLLAAYLKTRGIRVTTTREPGGTPTGEAIRALLQHNGAGEAPVANAELLLFLASRAQHVACVIRPALAAGHWVLCDRFDLSTYAYQGYGRGFDLAVLRTLNGFATQALVPDLTLLLDIPPQTGCKRLFKRQCRTATDPDRFECEAAGFHARVREGFFALARQHPERVAMVDTNRACDETMSAIQRLVAQRFFGGEDDAG